MYRRLRKLGGKIKLPVGKYEVTLPVCLYSLPEIELNINYINETLDMEKQWVEHWESLVGEASESSL